MRRVEPVDRKSKEPIVRQVLMLMVCTLLPCLVSQAAETVLIKEMLHLRIDAPREWREFPVRPDAACIELSFSSTRNATPGSLRLRQQDVKQAWLVSVNDHKLGQLRVDENDMIVYFVVPPGVLITGKNQLRVAQDLRRRSVADDVRVGEIVLDDRPVESVLGAAMVTVVVTDHASGQPSPARITVLRDGKVMQSVGAKSAIHLAVRPGVVYTSTGSAKFGLPTGRYTIQAGRGFEYSLASQDLHVQRGVDQTIELTIQRQVDTDRKSVV